MLSRFFYAYCIASASKRAEQINRATIRPPQARHLAERIGKYNIVIDCKLLACLLNITLFFGRFGDIFCNVRLYPCNIYARAKLVAALGLG